MHCRDTRDAVGRRPAPAADLDPEDAPPERPEDVGVRGVIPCVDREDAPPARVRADLPQETPHRRGFPATAGRDEVPYPLALDDPEARLARDASDPSLESADGGRRHAPVVDGERVLLGLEPRAPVSGEEGVEASRRRAEPRPGRRGGGVRVAERRPAKLEAVAAAVDDPRKADPPPKVFEGPAGDDRQPDSPIGGEPPERASDRRVKTGCLWAGHNGRERPVEVEDEEEARARAERPREPVLESAERPAQGDGVREASTGSRQSSPSRRPAQR